MSHINSLEGFVLSFYRLNFCLVLAFAASFTPVQAAPMNPVRLSASAKAIPNSNSVELTVDVEIAKGWHIYGSAGESDGVFVTELKLDEKVGVEAKSDWEMPLALPYGDLATTVYKGKVQFRRRVEITDLAVRRLSVKVSYQACNDKLCNPPSEELVQAAILKKTKVAGAARFEAPVILDVASTTYPSPALYDVDNDGKNELIVGDIFGRMVYHENESESSQGEPVWSEKKTLNTADGKAIRVSNW